MKQDPLVNALLWDTLMGWSTCVYENLIKTEAYAWGSTNAMTQT